MRDPRNFSRAVKRESYKRANGRCENPTCRIALPAGWGGINYDHIINWATSRDSSLENCQVLCAGCHLWKTSQYDTPTAAKCQRIEDERIGIKRPGKKLPGGKDSNITITMNRGPQPRVKGRGEKHQRTMADRYSFGWRPE